MKLRNLIKKAVAGIVSAGILLTQLSPVPVMADSYMVVTIGADLTAEQRQSIFEYFNVNENDVLVITVNNNDEREMLLGQYTSDQIGTKTFSCALVNPTTSGGIQVKTANMNVVTSDRISSMLVTCGVTNCEVLTAAPYMVSGTGALTGVLMAYESASGDTLDSEKKEMAVEESKTTSEIGEKMGQDGATLVVNDIKIRIVRDGVADDSEVVTVVDESVANVQNELQKLAATKGEQAPQQLSQEDMDSLYSYGSKLSKLDYNYDDMKLTLQRVTNNITTQTGIEDPITDTFEDLSALDVLPENSVLRETNDSAMGEEANITATNQEALAGASTAGNIEAGKEALVTGVEIAPLTEIADGYQLLQNTNLVICKKPDSYNYYGLADINGNKITDYSYYFDFHSEYGLITAGEIQGESLSYGLLDLTGNELIPCTYFDMKIMGMHWACGISAAPANTADYDYSSFSGNHYMITAADLYYVNGNTATKVTDLTRDQYVELTAKGDYVNIKELNGTVTTYDSSFNSVGTAESRYSFQHVIPEEYSEYKDPSSYTYGIQDKNGNVVVAPFADYIGTVYGDKCTFGINGDDFSLQDGLVSITGEIILPAAYDSINTNTDGPYDYTKEADSHYGCGGYYLVTKDDKNGYAIAGGTETVAPTYSYSEFRDAGASGYYKGIDGTYTLVAGDGVVTTLDSGISFLTPLYRSGGMIYSADDKLIDWHGNTLLENSRDAQITADGKYIAVTNSGEPMKIYKVTYLTSSGEYDMLTGTAIGGGSSTTQKAENDSDAQAPTPDATGDEPAAADANNDSNAGATESTDSAGAVQNDGSKKEELLGLLNDTLTTLQGLTLDDTNRETVSQILELEIPMAEEVDASVAATLSSAKMLVDNGAGDTASVIVLLESAIKALEA